MASGLDLLSGSTESKRSSSALDLLDDVYKVDTSPDVDAIRERLRSERSEGLISSEPTSTFRKSFTPEGASDIQERIRKLRENKEALDKIRESLREKEGGREKEYYEMMETSPVFQESIVGRMYESMERGEVRQQMEGAEPIISEDDKQAFVDTTVGLAKLAGQPYDVAKGLAEFAVHGIPSFIMGLGFALESMNRALPRFLSGGSWLDLYEAAASGFERAAEVAEPARRQLEASLEAPRKLIRDVVGDEVTKYILGLPENVSPMMIGEVGMAPATGVSMIGYKLAEQFDDPDVKGLLLFATDAAALAVLGRAYHGGGENVVADIKGFETKARDIAKTKSVIEKIPDEGLKAAQKEVLRLREEKLKAEAKALADKLDYGQMIKEDLKYKVRKIKKIKQPKREILDEQVNKAMEKLPEPKVSEEKAKAKAEPKRKKVRPKKKGPTEISYKDVKSEAQEVFDIFDMPPDKRDKLRRKRKIRVIEQVVEPGEAISIPPTMHDAHFRYTAARTPEGELQMGRAGSYDTILMEGQVAGAKEGPIPPGSTLYIFDTGASGTAWEVNTLRIYRSKPRKGEVAGEGRVALPETTTDIDMQTGSRVPPELKGDNSPFREKNVEAVNALKKVYEEHGKGVAEDPELFAGKLINDVNRWLNGEDLPINDIRGGLSELATRAEELRYTFAESPEFPSNYENWRELVTEAAAWAREVDRLKIKRSGDVQLNLMIPIDQVPKLVSDVYRRLNKDVLRAGDLYRNKDLFELTGYWLGMDGKWRYEIDRDKIRFNSIVSKRLKKGQTVALGALIDGPSLYNAVPDLQSLLVRIDKKIKSNAYLDYKKGEIVLKKFSEETLEHEMQHAVNLLTGSKFLGSSVRLETVKRDYLFYYRLFKDLKVIAKTEEVKNLADSYAGELRRDIVNDRYSEARLGLVSSVVHDLHASLKGSERDNFNLAWKRVSDQHFPDLFRSYMRDPGEMEARLTGRRMNMPDKKRRMEAPWETLDEMLVEERREHKFDTLYEAEGQKLYTGIPIDEAKKLFPHDISMQRLLVDFPKIAEDIVKRDIRGMRKGVMSLRSRSKDELANYVEERLRKAERIERHTNSIMERDAPKGSSFEVRREYERIDELIKIKGDQDSIWLGEEMKKFLSTQGEAALGNPIYRDMRRRLFEESSETLYTGIPIDKETFKKLAKGAEDFDNYLKGAYKYRSFKLRVAINRLKEELVRSFIDRSGNIRRDLLDSLGDIGYDIIQKMYLSKGASALAADKLRQMRKEVYRGLSKTEKMILDGVILARRMNDIASYKPKFNFPEDISSDGKIPDKTIAWLKTYKDRYKLSSERAAEIERRADAYFDWMKKPLEGMLKEGLISQEEYNQLIKHEYRRIELRDIYDKRYKAKLGRRTRTVQDSGIESLARGRVTDIYEQRSEIMALEVFNRSYGRMLNNRANKALLDLARSDSSNPFVRVKEKGKEPIPTGWNRIFVFEEGQRKAIYLSPKMSQEWILNNPEISYKFGQVLRYASGSPVLRTFATGINWGFALANLPRDVMHLWHAARVYEGGRWRPVYSIHSPIFTGQITSDLARVSIDAFLRKGRYNDYIDQGGGMEFLVHQGRLLQRGRHIEGPLDAFYNYLGHFGETSEIMTRLAIRDRVIRKRAAERGISYEEAVKNSEITQEATFAARDYMDFGQGGGIAKALDNAFPYLNASIQGTRGLWRSIKDNKWEATYRLSQYAALVAGITIASRKLTPETTEALRGNIDMQNNLCIPLGDDFSFIDSEGQERYIYFKIPLDPGQKFFKTFFEAATDKWLGNEVDVDRVIDSLKEQSPAGVGELPPSLSAFIGYVANKDFWLNEDIWRKTDKPFSYPKSKEEYIPGETPEAYIDLGAVTGLSPERTKYFVEELTTNGTVWSYLLGQGYEAMFSDLPKSEKEKHIAEVLSQMPMARRFIGVTNPYSRFASGIEKAKEKSDLDRFIQNRGLDLRVEGYLYKDIYSRKEIVEYARSFKDKDVYDRLMDRFKYSEAIKDLPNRSLWLRMKGLSPEARAKVYVDRLNKSTQEQRQQLMRELSTVIRAGGVVTPEFREEVMKLRSSEEE